MEAFAELGFPTTHLEDWKYTNVAPLTGVNFQPAQDEYNDKIAEADQEPAACGDGNRPPGFCERPLPAGAFLAGRACQWREVYKPFRSSQVGRGSLEAHLGRYADFKNHAFVALNTAFMEEGGFIEIPKGVVLEKPLHLLFISPAGTNPGWRIRAI